jgi:hypothetical protein
VCVCVCVYGNFCEWLVYDGEGSVKLEALNVALTFVY